MTTPSPLSILIINPNTSTQMTTALDPAIRTLGLTTSSLTNITYFTSPTPGIPSINSPSDATLSAQTCLPALLPLLATHDAFLVACYSHHPLVQQLQAACDVLAEHEASQGKPWRRRQVTGIFEASVTASLNLVGARGPDAAFGIVSTGKVWEDALAAAVEGFLGGPSRRFVGCETTGLNASELHEMPAGEVKGRMMEATKRLVRRGREQGVVLRAVCLGCAGMVGLEEAVREALAEEMGTAEAGRVGVVDGVRAGVGELVALGKGGF